MSNQTKARTWEESPFPSPSYPCSIEGCAETQTYPADMLNWYPCRNHQFDDDDNDVYSGEPGWFCDYCATEMFITEKRGISLERAMQLATQASQPDNNPARVDHE